MNDMNEQQFQTMFTLIQDFKSDMKDFKSDMNRRFEQVDKRFEQVDSQIKELKFEMREMKGDIQKDRNKLQEVYESRNKVAVSFTRSWAMASFFISISSSAVVLVLSRLL